MHGPDVSGAGRLVIEFPRYGVILRNAYSALVERGQHELRFDVPLIGGPCQPARRCGWVALKRPIAEKMSRDTELGLPVAEACRIGEHLQVFMESGWEGEGRWF